MITKVFSATATGLHSSLVECEVSISNGLPAVVMVGLPDKAVQESKERIRSAITQSDFEFPMAKITINLAPAGVAKSGSGLDLPIAIGILKIAGFLSEDISKTSLFVGELSLDGRLRAVNSVLSICLWAKENGYLQIFVPKENYREASLVKDLKVFAIEDLVSLVKHLNLVEVLEPVQSISFGELYKNLDQFEDVVHNINRQQVSLNKEYTENGVLLTTNDLAYVRGQAIAKRALEIASCGGHNLLFIGEPGSGKTLLARSYATILPQMTEQEVLEVTQVYSSVGLLPNGKISLDRPFRSPHHSSSHISLVGGGSRLRPGEVSLAHRGVLFLDEFPEFSLESIEALRQPLEDGYVSISRASGSATYPARFHLIAAANPSPTGYKVAGAKNETAGSKNKYKSKFSGPILDRIDLQVEVNRPEKSELESDKLAEPSLVVLKRVQAGRDIQNSRYEGMPIQTNAEMSLAMIKKYCQLDTKTKDLLSLAIDKFGLSARGYMRLLKVARTIADLDASEGIQHHHLAESLQYRGKW